MNYSVLNQTKITTAFDPFSETVYLQHCPMADDNNGASWLSKEKEIRNPYFGARMLKCGSVEEVIGGEKNKNH